MRSTKAIGLFYLKLASFQLISHFAVVFHLDVMLLVELFFYLLQVKLLLAIRAGNLEAFVPAWTTFCDHCSTTLFLLARSNLAISANLSVAFLQFLLDSIEQVVLDLLNIIFLAGFFEDFLARYLYSFVHK